jgi:hypothetical protein
LNSTSEQREVVFKISTVVQSRGVGGQNWVKFGHRSC